MNLRLQAAVIPVAFFLCGVIGIGLLYRVIAANETQRVHLETEITADQVRRRLEAWIDSRTALVEHLGTGHFENAADVERNFEHDALTFVELYPGIQALNFIDRDWVIRQVVPAATNAPALDQNLHEHPNSSVVNSLNKAETSRQLTGTSLIELLQGGMGFATYRPLVTRGDTDLGFVNGVFRIQPLVDACLYESVLRERFSFRLIDDDGTVGYTHLSAVVPEEDKWQVGVPLQVVDRRWFLFLTPDADYLAQTRTSADEIMAATGVLLIAGLAALLRMLLLRQEALRQSQAKYRLLVENQIDLVVQLDPMGHFLYVSPSFCESVGRSEAELLGTSFLPLVHPEDREASRNIFAELREPPHRSYNEQRSLTRNGVAWQAWINAAVLDDAGNLETITAVGRDITRRRELEEQLALSRKMQAVGQLAGGIAHDFNNLLQAMLGNLQFVSEDAQLTGQSAEDLQEIERGIDKAMILTRQLLTFSHKQALQSRREDLNAVVGSTVERIQSTLRSSVNLDFEAEAQPLPVQIDRGQVEQIVHNLCDNARDAIATKGVINVSTSARTLDAEFCAKHPEIQPGRFAAVTVQDDGHGMPPEVLERVFEPFYTTQEVGAGAGLGLATSYGIVQQHQGTILATSTVGEGSRFTVLLPMAAATDESTTSDLPGAFIGNGETILLAEDDASVRELAVRVLERANYTVLAVEDGERAIEVFEANQDAIDLVMLDMVMPKKGGREAQAAIVALRPDVPILFASGYDPATLEGEGATAAGQEILMKPYGIPDLLRMVRQILERPPSAGRPPS